MSQAPSRLYTRPFILLCLSNVLFSGSFNMMIPELPNFLTSMGGAGLQRLYHFYFHLVSRAYPVRLAANWQTWLGGYHL